MITSHKENNYCVFLHLHLRLYSAKYSGGAKGATGAHRKCEGVIIQYNTTLNDGIQQGECSQLSWMRGERGMSEAFSLPDSYGLFSRNSSIKLSMGMARRDSIAALLGNSGSDLIGVSPLGS